MPMLKPATKVAIAAFIVACLCRSAMSQGIPERKLHFASLAPGIGLYSTNRETEYMPMYVPKYLWDEEEHGEEEYKREVVLPANEPIVMILHKKDEYDPEDVKRICAQSPYVVQELRIISTLETDDVDKVLTSMATQKTLKILSFSNCDVTTFTPLVNIPSLEGVALSYCDLPDNVDFAEALAKTNVKWLSFHGTGKTNIFEDISRVKSLEKVSFWKSAAATHQISNIGLLNALPHLQRVGLKDLDITSDSLRYISQLSSIQSLDLSYTGGLADTDFGVLRNMKGLKEVEVENSYLSRKSFAALQALKGVTITGKPELIDSE